MNLKYRSDIDGLRALAVLSVIFFHLDMPVISGGFVGVDIFFVISGFLITSIIAREIESNKFSFVEFWCRRVRRILPASLLVVAVCLLAGYFLLTPADYVALAKSAKQQAFFLSNVYFLENTGYFDSDASTLPLLHTWSLAIEEQFYLVLPLALVLIQKYFPNKRLFVFTAVLLCSFAVSVVLIEDRPSSVFFLLHTRAWELMAGGLLAILPKRVVLPQRTGHLLAWFCLIVLLTCIALYNEQTVFPSYTAAPVVLATVGLIWVHMSHKTFVSKALSWRPVVMVGLISYPLYLWHWPLIAFYSYRNMDEPSTPDKALMLLATFLLATATWWIVEEPIRRKRILDSTKSLLITAAVCVLALVATADYIAKNDGFSARLPDEALKYTAFGTRTAEQERCANLSQEEIDGGNLCLYENKDNSAAKLLVWGDSHAYTVLPQLRDAAKNAGVDLLFSSKGGCPPFTGLDFLRSSCQRYNEVIYAQLKALGLTDILLVARWSIYINGNPSKPEDREIFTPALIAERKQQLSSQFKAQIEHFSQLGVTVWVMNEVPTQPFDTIRQLTKLAMLESPIEQLSSVSPSTHVKNQRDVVEIFESPEFSAVKFLATEQLLCTAAVCSAFDADVAYYTDDNHLSNTGAKKLRPLLFNMLADIDNSASKQ